MNRVRLTVSSAGIAVLLAGTVRLAAGWFPLIGEPEIAQQQPTIPAGNAQASPSSREPIKIRGDIMQSKLIHKVNPIYPEQAKALRIWGRVQLVMIVNEEGFVSDVRVITGHPLLVEPAVTAVKQWQYIPILLNGEAVPVTTTATVVFVAAGDKTETGSGLSAPPPPPMRGSVFHIAGRDSHILFRATPIDEKGSPSANTEGFLSPQLATTMDLFFQWQQMAGARWPADVAKGTPLIYSFIVNEEGKITNFTRVQGPEIPDLEKELSQARVVSPAFRGSTLVRSLCTIEFRVGISFDEIQNLLKSN